MNPTTALADNLEARLSTLFAADLDYIDNESFAGETPEQGDLRVLLAALPQEESVGIAELPAHLRRLCDAELLTPEQESELFRVMNLLKFRASELRDALDADAPSEEEVAAIESLISAAREVRDHLIQANMRLVMSIVKKFVTPQHSFDDLLSDGIFVLMQAVEKFDYDRGFRFSTYAYRSIARHAYRSVSATMKEEARMVRDSEEWALEQPASSSTSALTDQIWSNLRDIMSSMLQGLDRRERFIIRSRYALGAHRKVRSFQYLADKLGVSKERVRQLEQRAVGKLKAMAGEHEMDDLFAAAMV